MRLENVSRATTGRRIVWVTMTRQHLQPNGASTGLFGFIKKNFPPNNSCSNLRFQPVLDRIVAQVWDSAADISEISIGVPAAVFPKNKIMQKTLKTYME